MLKQLRTARVPLFVWLYDTLGCDLLDNWSLVQSCVPCLSGLNLIALENTEFYSFIHYLQHTPGIAGVFYHYHFFGSHIQPRLTDSSSTRRPVFIRQHKYGILQRIEESVGYVELVVNNTLITIPFPLSELLDGRRTRIY